MDGDGINHILFITAFGDSGGYGYDYDLLNIRKSKIVAFEEFYTGASRDPIVTKSGNYFDKSLKQEREFLDNFNRREDFMII